MITDLLRHIIKSLVDKPEMVSVDLQIENGKRFIEIRVDPDDFGRVIGKEGRTFKAIQALAVAVEPGLQERNITIDTSS